jgi:UDP-N-acetylmuramoyl-tripeptide--D-alanyl-D-alanine ligase
MKAHKLHRTAKPKRWLLAAGVAAGGIILTILVLFLHPLPHRFLERPTLGFCSKRLNQAVLDRSLKLGTQFMLNNQKSAGNFNYQYDWVKRTYTPGESQVRQAGAMWGLALIYQDEPTPEVGTAVEKAMKFFEEHSKTTPDGARYVVYPGDTSGRTGTVALCTLTYIDYLHAARSRLPAERYPHYRRHLDAYLKFLVNARTSEGLWHQSYRMSDGQPFGGSSPYFDGESLLALIKAAKYMDRSDLKPVITVSADAGYRHNIEEALREHPDSKRTKGYYQWSSMAFFELATTGWPSTQKYGDYVLDLADWMIDVHKTLNRRRNTGYAYEGIIHAYQLAVQRKEARRAKKFACVIDTGLEKLTSWQVGSPLANRFIREHPTNDPMAIGGVQNHRREAPLRIDVAQHQMHAVILARRYVYAE